MTPITLEDALTKYKLYAGAKGYSPPTVNHVTRSVRSFGSYLAFDDPQKVTAEDLQCFLVYLCGKKVWSETPHPKDHPLKRYKC